MGHILAVPQALCRGVGHQDVHAPRLADGPAQAKNPAPHLPVRILVGAGMILPAAPQAHDPQAVVFHDLAVNVVAALGRDPLIDSVVVSRYIQHRAPGHGYQKAQIAGIQISAGNNQLVVRQPPGDIVIPQSGTGFIRDYQDLHGLFPLSFRHCLPCKCPVPLPWGGHKGESPRAWAGCPPHCRTASPYAAVHRG